MFKQHNLSRLLEMSRFVLLCGYLGAQALPISDVISGNSDIILEPMTRESLSASRSFLATKLAFYNKASFLGGRSQR